MKTLLQTIGKTPLIRLNNFISNTNINLLAKLEGQNPSGSIKDRVAQYMVMKAEERGELTPNKVILDASSGNMGIALATVGAHKGYEVHILMSEAMSEERKMILRALGAKLIVTDKKFGTQGAIAQAKEMALQFPSRYWFANQFNNPDNVESHYHGIAKELLSEIPQIDYLFAGVGTSGTIMGIAKRFKVESPNTKIIGVLPPAGYQIQGLQNPYDDFRGSIFQGHGVHQFVKVSVDDAFQTARSIVKREGVFVGMSSGAALLAAIQMGESIKSGNIVVIFPDRGEKYLSTTLYSSSVAVEEAYC